MEQIMKCKRELQSVGLLHNVLHSKLLQRHRAAAVELSDQTLQTYFHKNMFLMNKNKPLANITIMVLH